MFIFSEIIMAVTVIAIATAKDGKEAELKAELTKLVEPSRKDEGCIGYVLHQSIESGGEFMFYEKWESKELLQQHIGNEPLQNFMKISPELLNGELIVSLWNEV